MFDDFEIDDFALIVDFAKESPFPYTRFESIIEDDRGYEVSDEMKMGVDTPDSDGINPTDVYSKDGLNIAYLQRPGVLVFSADDCSVSFFTEELIDIRKALAAQVGVDNEDISSFDLKFEARIWEGEDTVIYFDDMYSVDFSDVLDGDCQPFSVRVVSGHATEGDLDYDVRLEPYARNSEYFYVQMRRNFDTAEETATSLSDIEETILKMIMSVKNNE